MWQQQKSLCKKSRNYTQAYFAIICLLDKSPIYACDTMIMYKIDQNSWDSFNAV